MKRLSITSLLLLCQFAWLANCAIAASDYLVPFSLNGKIGYVTQDLKVIIQPRYLKGSHFTSEGYAAVRTGGSQWAIIDRKGKELISIQTSVLWHLTRDTFAYYAKPGAGTAIIRASDGAIIAKDLGSVYNASEDLIPVRIPGKGWTYIDLSGRLAFGECFFFKRTSPFSEGIAIITQDNWLSGCINKDGDIVIEPQFAEMGYQFSSGLCFVRRDPKGKHTGYIDRSGKYQFEIPIKTATPFEGDVAIVQTQEEPSIWYIINRKGEFVSPQLKIAYSRGFSEGLALVQVLNGEIMKYRFINASGEYEVEHMFDEAEPFTHGFSRIIKNGREGLLRRDGIITWSDELVTSN